MRRTRVLQLIPDLAMGGAERMVVNLATALDRRRFDVVVMSLFPPRRNLHERLLSQAGVRTVFLEKHLGFDLGTIALVRRAMERLDPDVVHTHRYALGYALPALASMRASAVHTVHNLAEFEVGPLGRIAHRAAFDLKVHPIAIGAAVARSIEAVYKRPPYATIPHGIPIHAYERATTPRDEWRRREGIAPDDVVMVCVARLAPQKNVEALLEALAMEPMADDRARLVIAGDGEERRALEDRARSLGVAGRVRFLGVRPDIPDLLGAADLFVLSSRYEGNPLAVMEAMAAGLPVVSFGVGGVPEFVVHGETGFLVPDGDVAALARDAGRLIADASERVAMGRRGHDRALRLFDVAVMARCHERVYEACCQEARARAS